MGLSLRKRFRPGLLPTLACLSVVAVTSALGVWQLSRSAQQRARSAWLEETWAAVPVTGGELHAGEALAYRRARVDGVFEPVAPALITGGLVAEEAGYRWFAPMRLASGERLLVERGWVPATVTRVELDALAGPTTIDGYLVPLEGVSVVDGRVTDDGRVLYPLATDRVLGILPRVLGPPLATLAEALDADELDLALLSGPRMDGETRREPGPLPIGGYTLPVRQTHHLSYAAQWFAIAGLFLGVWVWTSMTR